MAVYNIPGITTSVIDISTIAATVAGGRTPLIIGPSKFGPEEISDYANFDELTYNLGNPNYTKYGLALEYAVGALTVTGNLSYKRLLPSDATYANICIDENVNSTTVANLTDKTVLENTNLLNHIATSRGEGYNEFFIKYDIAPDIDKIYADGEGDPKYNFNFLKATIYQNSPTGIKTIASTFGLSLIDIDPKDNTPILDITTGETLYINSRLKSKNVFVEALINENLLPELKKYINISDVLAEKGTPEIILKDISTGTNYKVKGDIDHNLYVVATNEEGMDKVILKYQNNGADNYVKLYVDNGAIQKESTTDVSAADTTYEHIYIVGDYEFLDLYIDSDTQELKVVNFDTLRAQLYKKLTSQVWVLENGFDGKNLHINNVINFNGPSEAKAENVKQLYLQFLNTDSKVREVMYPEYNFNYIVDWSTDLDIEAAIINLTDDIGNVMGIMSLPYSTSSDQDYKIRTELLYQSTYNNALYSGQWNTNHYDEFAGKYIGMPLSYYMMILHLKIDNEISITEPVAGMVKGQMPVANMKLSYTVSSAEIEKLRNVQINTIIKEKDGIYMIDQLTMYKKASKLSRINVVKVIHQMRRDLPQLLKKYIQTKETSNVIGSATNDVNNYMNKWLVSGSGTNPDEIFSSIQVNSIYIPEEYKLVISIRVNPIGTIEKIDIPIIVE
jgi:hypothetical protein